jgi:hypothetical protein
MKCARTIAASVTTAVLASGALGQVSFLDQQPAAAGDAPTAIASGDFDGDNDLDLAVANRDDGTVSILTNDGSGGFTAGQTITLGDAAVTRPFALAVADFDEDGNLDLAVALLGLDQVAVLLGGGDGTFGTAATLAVGDRPSAIAVGDFDGANGPDLIASNENADTVSVLLNDGAGGFMDAIDTSVDPMVDNLPRPKGIAAADFDGDGNVDFAAALLSRNQVGVRLGAGDGTFGDLSLLDVGNDPWAVLAVDLDADGNIDLVVTNAVGDSVTVLRGDGAGGFTSAGEFAAGNRPEAVVAADFDDDGDLDLATANREGDNLSVLAQATDGTFGAATTFVTANAPSGIVAGDLNGDAMPDLATANQEADNVSVLLAGTAVMDDPLLDGTLDGLTDAIMDCGGAGGAGCAPMGLAPMLLTLVGIAGLKRGRRFIGQG